MAQTTHLCSLLLALLAKLFFLLTTSATGFRLELIHRDSIYSPFYRPNLTESDRLRRDIDTSNSRALWLSSIISGTAEVRPDAILAPLQYDRYHHIVRITLGTPPHSYFLTLDTGSSLVWLQCRQCSPRFDQPEPLFDPRYSSTYHAISGRDPLCAWPASSSGGKCAFDMTFLDGSSVEGTVAKETFTFQTTSGRSTSVDGIAFGCAEETRGFSTSGMNAGILGMGGGELSMASQISHLTGSRFSYCIMPTDESRSRIGYLRFGDDVRSSSRDTIIPLVRSSEEPSLYFLDLVDISVDGRRLHISPGTFARYRGVRGGCFIDSGANLSYLIRRGYNVVRTALVDYFGRLGLHTVEGYNGLDLCVSKPEGFRDYPSIAFHFGNGAKLQLGARQTFISVGRNRLCFAVLPHDHVSILGAYQQQNFRFIYDLANRVVRFHPENCLQDGDD